MKISNTSQWNEAQDVFEIYILFQWLICKMILMIKVLYKVKQKN